MQRSISLERTLAISYDAAFEALRDAPADMVLDDPASRTLVLRAEVGGFDVARPVTVTLGELRQLDPRAVALPLSWQATEHPRRFPTFTGMVELSALSQRPPQSQVALVGTVTTPLGVLGTVAEAAGGTALADVVLAALVDRVAARLSELVATRAADAAAATTRAQLSRPRVVITS